MTARKTDELDALKVALSRPTTPDPATKADAIALAMKKFDAFQETSADARPNQDRPSRAGFLNGVRNMLTYLTSRPILSATTSAAALCVGLIAVMPLTKTPITSPVIPANKVAPAPQQSANAPGEEPPTAASPAHPKVAEAAEKSAARSADAASNAGATTATGQVRSSLPELQKPAPGTAAPITSPSPTEPALRQTGTVLSEAARMGVVSDSEMSADAAIAAAPEMAPADQLTAIPDTTEAFANAPTNPVTITSENPVSTFSIDVDTASYSIVRQSLNAGVLPPSEAVRVEEMVNYFPYTYTAPQAGEAPFKSTVSVMQTPWNPGTKLVHIGLQGRLPALDNRPPLNLVFLIDTSGSMDEPNKLPLLKQSLKLLLPHLRPEDEIAIVAYAGAAGEVLPPTKAEQTDKILSALDNLAAGGATAGAEGLALAYQVAEKMGGVDQVSRILLATDGDFNVGVDDPAGLTAYIARKRELGTYLSVLGFGRGNLDDATMQALAQNGNGQAAYIDTLNEARKVLVDQLTGALFPIANDVKIQVEWNPATVAEYRLIGYETRALQREDFNNDRVDAGEIGAGHSVTAIYEVTPPNSAALLSDPLRYATAPPKDNTSELGFLRLRYKEPGSTASTLIETPIAPETTVASDDARFAVAMAGFGQMLTGATYLGDWGWAQAIDLALQSRGEDPFGYRIEAVNLMRMAESLSAQ